MSRLPARPDERIDRSDEPRVRVRGPTPRGIRRRHDRAPPLRGRAARLLPQLQVPPAREGSCAAPGTARTAMMTVDGVPNVRVCTEPAPEGVVVQGQNVARLARPRLDGDHGQARRAVHAAGLLLQDVHPAEAVLAALREVPAERRRARHGRPEPARRQIASTSSTATWTCSSSAAAGPGSKPPSRRPQRGAPRRSRRRGPRAGRQPARRRGRVAEARALARARPRRRRRDARAGTGGRHLRGRPRPRRLRQPPRQGAGRPRGRGRGDHRAAARVPR